MPALSPGTKHTIPADLRRALTANTALPPVWNSLTPLARNEWICWITSVKKAETRQNHIERLQSELLEGKRHPCCWQGCPHHNPKNAKWFG